MAYPRLANAVAVFHKLYILFLVVGVFIGYHAGNREFRIVYGCIAWAGLLGNVLWWGCPLTYLEDALRGKPLKHGAQPGSFIARNLLVNFGWIIPAWVVTVALVVMTVGGTLLAYDVI